MIALSPAWCEIRWRPGPAPDHESPFVSAVLMDIPIGLVSVTNGSVAVSRCWDGTRDGTKVLAVPAPLMGAFPILLLCVPAER